MLTTRSTFDSLLPTFGSMRRDFERALGEVEAKGNVAARYGYSPLSMWQDEQHVYVHVDVPGMAHEELDVQFDDGKLWIRGERKWTKKDASFDYNERRFGRFERAVLLSDMIDPSSIDATLEDGVLCITLMKKPEAQPRSITIKHRSSPVKKLSEESSTD